MKRTIAILLLLVMVLSLVACGKPTLESLKGGIYYTTVSDQEIHYVFKDGIVYKQVYKSVPSSKSPSGKIYYQDSEEEVAKYRSIKSDSITIIDGDHETEYTYSMNESRYEVRFSAYFLDSQTKTFIFRG